MEFTIILLKIRDIPFYTVETTIALLLFAGFSILLFYSYKVKLINYAVTQDLKDLEHEKEILKVQLDMQETTFQNVSRELHDNIGLSLTLVKLKLNTIDLNNPSALEHIDLSISTLTQAIYDLSDISRSFNSHFIREQGFIKSLQDELTKYEKFNSFKINFAIHGEPIFLEGQKEVILFRIIQEAFNNILKHSNATAVEMTLNYQDYSLLVLIKDNGKGLPEEYDIHQSFRGSGLNNIIARTKLLGGNCFISSRPNLGTSIQVVIPLTL